MYVINAEVDGNTYQIDPLHSYDFDTMIVEVTSRCNLRCIFCPKSIAGNDKIPGRDMDMPVDLIDKTLELMHQIRPHAVAMVGVGELTFRKDWLSIADRFFNDEMAFTLNSNFGRLYSDQELDALLRFTVITISIESADPVTQKELRKAVDLSKIVANIRALQQRAKTRGVALPELRVNCTVSDRNAYGIYDLAELCVELDIDQFNLSSFYEMEGLESHGIHSIDHLSANQLGIVAREMTKIRDNLSHGRTRLDIQPRLYQLVMGNDENLSRAQGDTRICTQPWDTFTFGADGQIFPCCVQVDSFGHVSEPLETIINGPAIKKLRQQLLEGDLPDMCKDCSNAPLGKKEQLMQAISLKALRTGKVPRVQKIAQ